MIDKKTPYFFALLPILILIALLAYNVFLYGDNSLGGANQLALLFATATASFVGVKYGARWKTILNSVSKSIASTTPSIIILLLNYYHRCLQRSQRTRLFSATTS